MEPQEALEARERLARAAESGGGFARRAAVLVGVLAACLAIATLFGNQAAEDIVLSQERATDTFNEFQADSLKQRIGGYDATILGALNQPAAAGAAAKDAQAKGAGKARLLTRARAFEAERDAAERHHRSYQVAEAAFQIGIVLASIAIVARVAALVYLGGGLGVAGLLLLLNGLLGWVRLPGTPGG